MFKNKVVLVTGAAQGIGYEIAGSFAREGATVGLVDVNDREVKKSAEKLANEGYSSLAFQADVSNAVQVRQVVDSALEEWGRIDIMVNNAGICPITPPMEISPEEWDKVLGINLKGTFLFSQAVIPPMQEQGHGKIINIASVWGLVGSSGLFPVPAYNAAKGAVVNLTRELGLEYAPMGINVNAICPGYHRTSLHPEGARQEIEKTILARMPLKKIAMPNDIKGLAVWLASEASSFVTGQIFIEDGGEMA